MRKLFSSIAVSALLLAPAAFAQPQPGGGPMPTPAPPELGARSYILLDFNSQDVLVERNSDERVEPASIPRYVESGCGKRRLGQVREFQ
jgi:D-alanyl-D-alanine carboxypeptidase (penicillin-binding protein 5/6)